MYTHWPHPGTTPLYFACQEGRVEALKFLHVKGKCDLTTPSNNGLKPIHAACQCGHTNIVKVGGLMLVTQFSTPNDDVQLEWEFWFSQKIYLIYSK